MNKLKILKINISSTAILSFAMLICLIFSMLLLPIGIYYLVVWQDDKDIDIYSEELADYCLVEFPNEYYKDLCKTFDMENFAGLATAGYIEKYDINRQSYRITIVSDKMLNELPACDYYFSKTKPKDYREAYAPISLKYDFNIGDFLEISCYEGIYQYKQKIKIIGFTENEYYDFHFGWKKMLSLNVMQFLVYDEIPPYAKVQYGLMMSGKSADYYNELGAKAMTLRNLNEEQKVSTSSDTIIYWVLGMLGLLTMGIAANYYFSVDKMTKRSGVMAIFGAKCSDIVIIELIKLIMIFAVALILSAICAAIMIAVDIGTINWISYFVGVGITLAIYAVSVSFGFIKYARFDPLKALANNNIE